ncbi:MAG: deoxyribodipyrimidine photo-lyase, partial [Pseudomonadota bacterium]
MSSHPIIIWFRRDLRLSDHPALHAAAQSGRPIVPLFVCDEQVDAYGAAPKWRLGLGLEVFGDALREAESRLTLRSGDALEVLQDLIEETGATSVYWTRLYDPQSTARDSKIKTALKEAGIDARSFGGHLMFEPWTAETKTGGFYKVYTPFWKAVKDRDVDVPLPAPKTLRQPEAWPESDDLADWKLNDAMKRGAGIVRPYVRLGETAAQ